MNAYLHFGSGKGPFQTVSVPYKHLYADQYCVLYAGKWYRVQVQVKRLYITVRGEKVTVQLEGNPL